MANMLLLLTLLAVAVAKALATLDSNSHDFCVYNSKYVPVGEKVPLAAKCSWVVCSKVTLNNIQTHSLDVQEIHPGSGCCMSQDGFMFQDGANTTLYGGLEVSCCKGNWMQVVHVNYTVINEQPALNSEVVLLSGGYGPTGQQRSVEVFGKAGCSPTLNLPEVSLGHSSHYVDEHVLFCGGGNVDPSNTCYELLNGQFRTHSQLAQNRYFHSGVVVGGKLTLMGDGLHNDGYSADKSIETLTGTTWIHGTDMKHSVMASCAVELNDKTAMIIGGGDNGNEVFTYDGEGVYTKKRSLPGKRYSHGCVVLPMSGNVLVAGGYNNHIQTASPTSIEVLNSALMYVRETDTWVQLNSLLNTPRAGGKLVNLNGRILYFGGVIEDAQNPLDTVEEYSQFKESWTLLQETMDIRRTMFAAVVVPSSTVGC